MKVLDGNVLGVLGGMGPLATEIFYDMTIRQKHAIKDQDHINMIILSHATMPDRTKAIKENNTDAVLEKMIKDAKFLEDAGVCAIAIPCNTSHVLLDRIQTEVSAPIINMIEETVKRLEENTKEGSKIGVMATDGTISMGLYQKYLHRAGFESYVPSEDVQKLVMKVIYDGIKKGEPVEKGDFNKIEEEYINMGCNKVILGCTELSVYKIQEKLGSYYIDAMEVLADKSIELCER